jgi:uncharacterized membrane-anchored protein
MNRRAKVAAAWVVIQLGFFVGWVSLEQSRFAPDVGSSILVRVRPVDPRDLLRGQFLQLGYEFSRMDSTLVASPRPGPGSRVWVVLAPEGDFHVPERAQVEQPDGLLPGQVAMTGRVERGLFVFGIERYFVSEGTETPNWEDLTVRLRVGRDGRVRIEGVYVSGVPWP